MRNVLIVLIAISSAACGDLFFQLERELGDACAQDEECGSGVCSDGVCCDRECDSIVCVSCLGAETGGTDGTCLPVTSGIDPDDECPGVFGCEGAGDCQECNDFPDFTPCDDGWCYDLVCRPEVCTSVGCNIGGPGFVLGDTNQRVCFDDSSPIACESCNPWCGQDAQTGWDTEFAEGDRFTRSTEAEAVVLDNATGLSWRGCFVGQTGADCGAGALERVPWSDAHDLCQQDGWAGGDWRLPDIYELQSLVDSGGTSTPTLDASSFPMAPGEKSWTASVVVLGVLSVDFGSGRIEREASESAGAVQCVRGGRSPISERRFGFNAGVVVDRRTGLDWEQTGTAPASSWLEALSYCNGLTLSGASDWRLPSRVELASLINVRERTLLIDSNVFPDAAPEGYWSSTSDANDPGQAWEVDFGSGESRAGSKSGERQVRCVRTR